MSPPDPARHGMSATQLTLSALIICFGGAQLILGPLADRFGWPALQGAGMAAAVTCARSIVRDLFAPQEGARVMSRALSGLGVIAMASPVVGGIVVQWLDWHAALLVVAVFGAAALAIVAWRHEETVPARHPRATQFAALAGNWRAVLSNPTFRAWTLLSGFACGALFFLLAGTSFAYIGLLGTSKVGYGAIMFTRSFAYFAGNFWCRRLLQRHGLRGAQATPA